MVMEDLVLWKPLYYTSVLMFILSLVLLPFNSTWSVITILALVTLWSRVPGFIHFIFNKLALNDLFTLIVAANAGWLTGSLFGVFGILFARLFGPNEWWPYTLRAAIAVFVAGAFVPMILNSTGGLNVISVYWFEGILYATYYIQVLLLWREEIGLEIMILPAVIFFDFFMNAFLIKLFGSTLSNMMIKGLSSGWPFIVFSGLILFFLVIAKNGKKIAKFIESIFGRKKETRGEDLAERIERRMEKDKI